MSILPKGYIRWDGTKYVIDSDVQIVGPSGPPGPSFSGTAAGGDLSGFYPNPTVSGLQGLKVSSAFPGADGYVLTWRLGDQMWEPFPITSGSATLIGDVSGPANSNTVNKIQNRPVAVGIPNIGNTLSWTGIQWQGASLNLAGGSNFVTGALPASNQASQLLGGDLSGTTANATVVKIQSRTVSSAAPTNNQVLLWNAGNVDWEPTSLTVGTNVTAGGAASGDLSGTYPNPTVAAIQGNTVTAGALTIGKFLIATSTSNWAATALSGDATGSAVTAGKITVVNINGASVPASGSLTTGNVLQVNGASSLTYAPVNLAGGANFVTGVLPIGNQASQTLAGDVTGTTAASIVSAISGTSPIVITPATFQWTIATSNPTIKQADQTGASTNGQNLTIQAQNATGTTSTGGNVVLTAGTGTTAAGVITLSNNVTFPVGNKFTSTGTNNVGDFITTAATTLTFGNTSTTGLNVNLFAQNNLAVTSTGNIFITSQGSAGVARISQNTAGGQTQIDGESTLMRDRLGNEAFRFVGADPSFRLDSGSGTFPATGIIRTKTYANQNLWTGRNQASGDAIIINQTNGVLTFGDTNATSGWSANYNGFTVTINARSGAGGSFTAFSGAAAGSFRYAEFASGRDNILFDITGTAGNNTKIRFAESIVPTIQQDTAVTATNGAAFSITAQTAKSGGGGNGGTLALSAGAKDGAGTDGSITLSTGATLQGTIAANSTWTLAANSTITSTSGFVIYRGATTTYLHATNLGVTATAGQVGLFALGNGTDIISIGSAVQALVTFTFNDSGAGTAAFDQGKTSITIKQNDKTTASGTGATTTIQAQNETGTTSTGGNLVFTSGTGTTAAGVVITQQGGTEIWRTTTTGYIFPIGLSTPTIKQADQTAVSTNGQLFTIQSQNATGTTSTGGNLVFTSGTGTTAAGTVITQQGGTEIWRSISTGLQFPTALSTPTIKQADQTAASTNGQALTVQAQNATGTTSNGGNLVLKQGTGTSKDGQVQIGTSNGVLVFTGSTRWTTRSVSAALTVDTTTTDLLLYCNSSGGAFTITLPPPTTGRLLLVWDKNGSAETNNITVAPNGAEKINAFAGNTRIEQNFGALMIMSPDGVDWMAVKWSP